MDMRFDNITPKQKDIMDNLIHGIKVLEYAIASPNYNSTRTTENVLRNLRDRLETMKKKPEFKVYIDSRTKETN